MSWRLRGMVLFALACGGSGPIIKDLKLSRNAGYVGEPTKLEGSFQYDDRDGDISQLAYEILSEDGARQIYRSPLIALKNPHSGSEAGKPNLGMVTLDCELAVTLAEPGLYLFRVWTVDVHGHASNKLETFLRISTNDPAP